MQEAKTHNEKKEEYLAVMKECMPSELTSYMMQHWIDNKQELRGVLSDALLPRRFHDGYAYSITVDYDKPVEEMLKLGKYQWSDKKITSENFPTEKTGKTDLTIKLICFNRYASVDHALKMLDDMGYRPAELRELLAFGEKHPDFQREFPIIALTVWQERPYVSRNVLFLDMAGFADRCIYLHSVHSEWNDFNRFCRFAAIPK